VTLGEPGSEERAEEPAISATILEEPTEVPSDSEATSSDGDSFASGPRHARKQQGSFWKELPVLVLLAFGLALLIKTLLVQAFFIPSESMVDTLNVGDRVLVNKVVYRLHEPRRGDVIVFENPHPTEEASVNPVVGAFRWIGRGLGFAQPADEDYIKRIIGLPGETISARDGSVYVTSPDSEEPTKVEEPYLADGLKTSNFGPVEIPEGQYFVMGDNRSNSNDSRFGLGTIPRDKIVGEAFVIIWPPGDWGGL
jgi:signal peptidase I